MCTDTLHAPDMRLTVISVSCISRLQRLIWRVRLPDQKKRGETIGSILANECRLYKVEHLPRELWEDQLEKTEDIPSFLACLCSATIVLEASVHYSSCCHCCCCRCRWRVRSYESRLNWIAVVQVEERSLGCIWRTVAASGLLKWKKKKNLTRHNGKSSYTLCSNSLVVPFHTLD